MNVATSHENPFDDTPICIALHPTTFLPGPTLLEMPS